MDLTPKVTTYGADDRSWLGSAHGYEAGEPITLDCDLFVATFGDFVPSGVALAERTSDGVHGPYGGHSNEVVVITRTATGGDVDITLDGETAEGVSIVAATTAAQVKAALESLSNVNVGDITVTGPVGGPFTVEFVDGDYAGIDAPDLDIDDADATGGTVTAEITDGGDSDGLDVGVGLLKVGVPITAGHMVGAALFRHGRVVEDNLPTNHGVDSGFKADVAGRIDFV